VLGTNRAPLRKATVFLQPAQGPANQSLSATTGASGDFSITGIPPGRYTLAAEYTGYLRGNYG